MSQKMSNAPVFYTLAVVHFSPVEKMASYAADVQESMRKHGYPAFTSRTLHLVNPAALLAQKDLNESPSIEMSEWHFADAEATTGFILHKDSVAFHTTMYDTFKPFRAQVLFGLELLHSLLSLSFIERIGIRYLDAVMPEAGESLKQYLIPEVLGLSGRLRGELMHSFSETMTKTEIGQLVSRSYIRNGSIGFPPDLVPGALNVAERFATFRGEHGVIDTDHFSSSRVTFDLAAVGVKLEQLHDYISESFYATVTEHAIATWK